jgi:hypothetical protein
MLSNIWVWDPGSGKNLFRIPDPGVKKARIPYPGSGSATLGSGYVVYKYLSTNQLGNRVIVRGGGVTPNAAALSTTAGFWSKTT